MLSRLVLGHYFLVLTYSLSDLTDDKFEMKQTADLTRTNTSLDTTSAISRQLINQETLIRMALEKKVHCLVKDLLDMKKNMATDVKQIQHEIRLLKSENQALKAEFKDQSNVTELLSGIESTITPSTGGAAFSAYLSVRETAISKDHTIKFDTIVTNIGKHYNQHSGMFTATEYGVYVFSWNIYCGTGGYIYSQLVVNSNVAGAMFTSAEGAKNIRSTTGVVVVQVNAGDVVYVRTHPTNGNVYNLLSHTEWRSSFSGWKLY